MAHADSCGPDQARPRLTVSVRSTGDGAQVVTASGELDVVSRPPLADALTDVLRTDPPPRVVAVDLSALTFCDSSGLNLLLGARLEAEQRAVPLHLAGLPPTVLRVFQITGADVVFPIHDRLDQALA